MKHGQYIGKKLSECPDGTKAVISDNTGFECVRQNKGGQAYECGNDDPMSFGPSDSYTVLHILTLGKPRPETLADEEEGVAWQDCSGGYIRWRHGAWLMTCHPIKPTRIFKDVNVPDDITLGGATRLGPITGIIIDGKPYEGGAQ